MKIKDLDTVVSLNQHHEHLLRLKECAFSNDKLSVSVYDSLKASDDRWTPIPVALVTPMRDHLQNELQIQLDLVRAQLAQLGVTL